MWNSALLTFGSLGLKLGKGYELGNIYNIIMLNIDK